MLKSMINNGQFKILPRVLLIQIFKELSLTDLLKMEIQNKYFRDLMYDNCAILLRFHPLFDRNH